MKDKNMNYEPKYDTTRQFEVADGLEKLWQGLLPNHPLPSRSQFLQWSAMGPETTAVYALNRAARKALRENFNADRVGRYVTSIIRHERDAVIKKAGCKMNNNLPTPEEAVAMIEAADAAAPNHYRSVAEEMLRSGEITPDSTFADAKGALEKRYPQQQ